MKTLIVTLFIPFLISFYPVYDYSDNKVNKIIHQMFDSIKNIKTLEVKINALERIEKKFLTAKSEIKLKSLPRKVYFLNRMKKLEILYNSEIDKHKALVKMHTFPFISLWLDPTGNLMRKNQHYTIHELGYEFIGKSIALTIKADKDGLNNFKYHGKCIKNGYSCYFLEYENKNYAYTDYVIESKETVSSIAYKLCVNDYLLRYKNDLLNDFGYLKKGKIIKVPTLYCQKAILFIDEKLYVPVALSVYDDIGLFESYEFTDIEINKGFTDTEFSKNNKEYGF